MQKFNVIFSNPDLVGLEVEVSHEGIFCLDRDTELENYVDSVKFKLVCWSENGKEFIGNINVIRIPSNYRLPSYFAPCYDMGKAMDVIEGCNMPDVQKVIMNPIHSKIQNALKNSDLYYISEVFTKEKYRNCGIGSDFLNLLPELIEHYFGQKDPLLCLVISPIDVPDDMSKKQAHQKLENFYQRNGFELYGNDVAVKCP